MEVGRATLVGSSRPLGNIVPGRHHGEGEDRRCRGPSPNRVGQAGLEVASAEMGWWPLGRRWSLVAKSKPLPIARAEIDRWLDTLEASLSKYDASVATWVPLVPGA